MRKHFLQYINNSATNKISNIFLTVVHILIHNGSNNGDIHRSLKYCIQNFKTSTNPQYKINIFYKTNLKTERKTHRFDNLFLLKNIATLNELVIKNTLVKIQDHFCFYGRVSPAS